MPLKHRNKVRPKSVKNEIKMKRNIKTTIHYEEKYKQALISSQKFPTDVTVSSTKLLFFPKFHDFSPPFQKSIQGLSTCKTRKI